MKTILFYLLLVTALAAKPQSPYTLSLNKKQIQSIPLHTEISTLLVFPDEVTTILGNGLTSDVGVKGSVIYQQGQVNPKTIVLKHLDGITKVLMTVMIGDDAYVFRLEPDDHPASVVYLNKSGSRQPAKQITEIEALLKARPMSSARIGELFRLAKQVKLLKSTIPQEYKGYSDKLVSYPNTKDGLRTSVARVVQFKNDEALLFFGSIRNSGSQPVRMADCQGMLKVGDKRFYHPTVLRASRHIISPNEIITFEGLIIGRNLSLENEFKLQLTKTR